MSMSAFCAETPLPDYWKPVKTKLIEFSWSSPGTEFLKENIETIEAYAPYDGLGIHVVGKGEYQGKKIIARHNTVFSNVPWKYEWFADAVRDLKATKFRKLTDNFIRTSVSPGSVDWFSDSDWAAVCNNFAIMSRIARECGVKGLAFDAEMYNRQLFTWTPESGHSREDTIRKVRQRGREFADAIFKEYPNQTFFCFYWLSVARKYMTHPETPIGEYSLAVPFMNGVYDRLPPEAKIVDGNEEFGYKANDIKDYERLRCENDFLLMRLVDKANYRKARMQTQLAPAFYLDAYLIPQKGRVWFELLSPEKADRVSLLHRNLVSAFSVADEYVWTWGERGRWWPGKSDKPGARWEEKAPGVTEAIRLAHDPAAYAEKIAAEKGLSNLAENPSFEQRGKNEHSVPKWSFWQGRNSKGTYGVRDRIGVKDSRGAFIEKASHACFLQKRVVRPGQRYLLAVRCRLENATPVLWIRWQNKNGIWNNTDRDESALFARPEKDGWFSAKIVATVPDESYKMVFMLSVEGGAGKVIFDDAVLYELE